MCNVFIPLKIKNNLEGLVFATCILYVKCVGRQVFYLLQLLLHELHHLPRLRGILFARCNTISALSANLGVCKYGEAKVLSTQTNILCFFTKHKQLLCPQYSTLGWWCFYPLILFLRMAFSIVNHCRYHKRKSIPNFPYIFPKNAVGCSYKSL